MNLPNHWISKDAGFKFKNIFYDVTNVLILESGSKKGRHLKVLAEVNLEKPLLRDTKLKYNDQEVWVEFKYENVATFCYYCGLVGHSERSCSARKNVARSGDIREEQYGEWLRADLNKLGYKNSRLLGKGIEPMEVALYENKKLSFDKVGKTVQKEQENRALIVDVGSQDNNID